MFKRKKKKSQIDKEVMRFKVPSSQDMKPPRIDRGYVKEEDIYPQALKITEDMWNEIRLGHKTKDVRKLNKNHIRVDDVVLFIDVNNSKKLGMKRIVKKAITSPSDAIKFVNHRPTEKFIAENYKDQSNVIIFELGDV